MGALLPHHSVFRDDVFGGVVLVCDENKSSHTEGLKYQKSLFGTLPRIKPNKSQPGDKQNERSNTEHNPDSPLAKTPCHKTNHYLVSAGRDIRSTPQRHLLDWCIKGV